MCVYVLCTALLVSTGLETEAQLEDFLLLADRGDDVSAWDHLAVAAWAVQGGLGVEDAALLWVDKLDGDRLLSSNATQRRRICASLPSHPTSAARLAEMMRGLRRSK